MVLSHRYISPDSPDWKNFDQVAVNCNSADVLPFLSNGINTNYFVTALVVFDDEKPLARAAIYFNPYLSESENTTWLIGNYECVNNNEIANYLFTLVKEFVKSKGGNKIIGPMNGSTWDEYRFNLSNASPMFFTEKWNNDYYNTQFSDAGFGIVAAYFSSIDNDIKFNHPDVVQRRAELESEGITFEELDLTTYDVFLEELFPFITEAFQTNHLYSPITKEDFMRKYGAVKNYIDPHFVIVARNRSKELVGLFFCLPDYLNKKEKGLVIKTIARKNTPELKGLGHVIGDVLYANAHKYGMNYIVHAFMHRKGTSVTISKNFNGISNKDYFLYGKEITLEKKN